WLASASYDGTSRVWNLHDLSQSPIVFSPGSSLFTVSFHPLRNTLAVGAYDGTVHLWDVDHPSVEPVTLKGQEGAIRALTFSADGNFLAAGGVDKIVQVWDLNIESVIEKACKLTGRNLTKEEWNQYVGEQTPYQVTCPQWPAGK